MCACLRYETSYVGGQFSVPRLGLFAGWTAHENSFASGQVFKNETGDVSLVFAGECLDDPAVKAELKQNGHQFSDQGGHYLVHWYEELGASFFEKLNGLFSGLLVDQRQGKIFLFNDRFGLERIYWHENKDGFYFASEAKALLRVRPELREWDAAGVTEQLTFNCTLGTKTCFRGIERLPGGSLWAWENGRSERGRYFKPERLESLPRLRPAEFEAQLQSTFKRILPRYFESESRLGIALTGGLDTRMIMANRSGTKLPPVCYTFTGPQGMTLDDTVAARVAGACGLEHHLLRLNDDFFGNFASHFDRTVFVTDGCFGLIGTHEIYFHRQARSLSALRLTGNYGSEVLRSISTFKAQGLNPAVFQPEQVRAVQAISEQLVAEKTHPDTFAIFKEIPWNLFGNMAAGRSLVTFRTPYMDNEIVALAYQMPSSLRKSSLPCLHLIKTGSPVLDQIPTDRGFISDRSGLDILCRRVFAEVTFKFDYHYNAGLPGKLAALNGPLRLFTKMTRIAGLHKFLQYSTWMRQQLAPYLRERLTSASERPGRFWSAEFVKQLAEKHISGRENYAAEINAVLSLEATERTLMRDLPRHLEAD